MVIYGDGVGVGNMAICNHMILFMGEANSTGKSSICGQP